MSLMMFIVESNAIEGVLEDPRARIPLYDAFLQLRTVTIADLENAANNFQPGARLRDQFGMNVTIGKHTPPRGGEGVPRQLRTLLNRVNKWSACPQWTHRRYKRLHPFTDGNGRTGRLLWLWQMNRRGWSPEGAFPFLQAFYYQTLAKGR